MKKLLLTLMFCLIATSGYAANTDALTDIYVNKASGTDDVNHGNATGSGAYATLAYAESEQDRDITGIPGGVTFHCEGAAADTSAVSFSGWITNSTHTIKIIGDAHAGIWDENHYRIGPIDYNNIISVDGGIDIKIDHLQVLHTGSSNPGSHGIKIDYAYVTVEISNCIFKGTPGGTSDYGICIYSGNVSPTIKIYNNYVYGFSNTSGVGIFIGKAGSADPNAAVYNNAVTSSATGISSVTGTLLKNNACFGNTADYAGAWSASSDYNLSADATADDYGTNAIVNATIDDTNDVVETATNSEDLHIKGTSSDLYNTGLNVYSDATLAVTSDIDSDTLTVRNDIGADEYPEEAAPATPPPTHHQIIIIGGDD